MPLFRCGFIRNLLPKSLLATRTSVVTKRLDGIRGSGDRVITRDRDHPMSDYQNLPSLLSRGKVFPKTGGKFQVNRIIYLSLSVKRLDATPGTVHPNYRPIF